MKEGANKMVLPPWGITLSHRFGVSCSSLQFPVLLNDQTMMEVLLSLAPQSNRLSDWSQFKSSQSQPSQQVCQGQFSLTPISVGKQLKHGPTIAPTNLSIPRHQPTHLPQHTTAPNHPERPSTNTFTTPGVFTLVTRGRFLC